MTMATRVQIEKWLSEAEDSYHALATGQAAAVFVDQNGERVEYNKVDMSRLRLYIDDLKRQLGLAKVGGPFRPWM